VALRLEGLAALDVAERPDRIEVATTYTSETAVCPVCKRSSGKVHDRRKLVKPGALGEARLDRNVRPASSR